MIAILDQEQLLSAALEEVNAAVTAARHAQPEWAQRPARERQQLARLSPVAPDASVPSPGIRNGVRTADHGGPARV
jgi:hypothetical protein